jgi:2,3-dimethylmalate lyase
VDGPRRLSELLADREPVVAPGAYDALSARLIEQAGFDACI